MSELRYVEILEMKSQGIVEKVVDIKRMKELLGGVPGTKELINNFENPEIRTFYNHENNDFYFVNPKELIEASKDRLYGVQEVA